MNPINNHSYRSAAETSKSSTELIKFVSIETWNRISFVHNYSNQRRFMRIFEVTLTQNIVYELIKFSVEKGLVLVGLYESKNEKTNGSDILLCVELSKGYLKIPIQAKLLSTYKNQKNGKYKSFWHKNKNGLQIDLLDKYSIDLGSYLGLFLFYNYTKGSKKINTKDLEWFYGCSYASCAAIMNSFSKFKNIKFSDLHQVIAKPFYHFFENGGNELSFTKSNPTSPTNSFDDIKDFYNINGMLIDDSFVQKIKFYKKEEIFLDDDNWRNLINSDETSLKEVKHTQKTENGGFNPKYRMVLVSTPTVDDNQKAEVILTSVEQDKLEKKKETENNMYTSEYAC